MPQGEKFKMSVTEAIISVYPFVIAFLFLLTFIVALFAYFARVFMLYTGIRKIDIFLYGIDDVRRIRVLGV